MMAFYFFQTHLGEDRKPAVTDEEESGSSTSSCDEMPPGAHDSSDTASAGSPGKAAEPVGAAGKEAVLRPPESTTTSETRPEKDYDSSATVSRFLVFAFFGSDVPYFICALIDEVFNGTFFGVHLCRQKPTINSRGKNGVKAVFFLVRVFLECNLTRAGRELKNTFIAALFPGDGG